MKSIKVSVIIPIFNEIKYIDGLIRSLQNQTFPADEMECIFADGGSNDGTKEKLMETNFPFQTFVLDNPGKSAPSAMNLGIQQANGIYIVRMDAHSVFPADYIQSCIDVLESTKADNVGGIASTYADGFVGNAIAKMMQSPFGVGNSGFRIGGKEGSVDTVPFGTFRKSLIEKIGLFDTELIRSEDNDFNARIIKNGGIVFLSEKIHFTYCCRDSVSEILKMALKNGNALPFTLKKNRSAMRIRHFIPLCFFLSILLLPLLGIVSDIFLKLFFIEACCYFILDIYFSFVKKERKLGLITIWLYPLFHICYGIGSLLGFLGIKMY